MKKRILLFALTLFTFLGSASAYDFSYTHNGKTLYYQITSSVVPYTVAVVPEFNGSSSPWYTTSPSGSVVIPEQVTYNGITYTVTAIGDLGFRSCNGITSISIPNSVTSIGSSAFAYCRGLISIEVPSSVSSIGDKAFNNCSGLTSVTIPNSVTTIGNSAFSNCTNLRTVNFNPRTSLSNTVFSYCSNIETFIIGDAVQGAVSLSFTKNLVNVTIGNSITGIDQYAFSNCTRLSNVTIGKSVTSIGYQAFYGCTSLSTVRIPNSVTSIQQSAFQGCSNLSSVTIPNSVTSIGSNAFTGCTSLSVLYNLSAMPSSYIPVPSSCTKIDCTRFGTGSNAIFRIPETYTAVAYNPGTNQVLESSISDIHNIIYKKTDGTWHAKNIVLTDGQDEFYAPVEFTADNATYTREFTDHNRSTLCLPFTTTIPTYFEVYEFTGFNGSTISFTKKESGNIEAYKPYLVGKDITPDAKANTPFTFSKQNAVFPATNITPVSHDNMTFQGVMARTQMTNTNTYGYKDGYFVQSGGSAHVNPFRCYFTLSGSQSAPATLSVDTDGDYLGIEDVDGDMEQTSIRYSNDVYDMMGRLVRKDAESLRGLPKGIYIWRGKKQIAY